VVTGIHRAGADASFRKTDAWGMEGGGWGTARRVSTVPDRALTPSRSTWAAGRGAWGTPNHAWATPLSAWATRPGPWATSDDAGRMGGQPAATRLAHRGALTRRLRARANHRREHAQTKVTRVADGDRSRYGFTEGQAQTVAEVHRWRRPSAAHPNKVPQAQPRGVPGIELLNNRRGETS
jgi:hypothetical protein